MSYYKYVLECKLVIWNIVISLDAEFIENEKMLTDKQKKKKKTTIFRYISDLDIKDYNIKDIISTDRKR